MYLCVSMCVHLCVYIPFVCGCEGASACLYMRDCSRCVCMHVRVCACGVCVYTCAQRYNYTVYESHDYTVYDVCVHNVRLHECVCG